MALVVKGEQGFTEQPKKRKWTPEKGWVTTREWQGPNTDSVVRAQENAVIALGADDIDTDTGIPAVITATFSDLNGGTTVIDPDLSERNAVWELIPLEVEKLIETHPEFSAANGQSMALAQKLIKEGKGTDTIFATDPFKTYLQLKMAGVDSYLIWMYTIRKSYSIAKASVKKLTFPYAGQVISYSSIKVPQEVKWTRPGTFMPGVTLVPAAFTWVTFDQWLEHPAQIKWNERSKQYDISVEWTGAESWSKNFYSGGTHDP